MDYSKCRLNFCLLSIPAKQNDTEFNDSLIMTIKEIDGYDGQCMDKVNVLNLNIKKDWKLKLNYTLANNIYQLFNIRFDYMVDALFPNASKLGPQSIEVSGLDLFSTSKDNSYKCTSETKVPLNDTVVLFLKNYQAEPFIDRSTNDFDSGQSKSLIVNL